LALFALLCNRGPIMQHRCNWNEQLGCYSCSRLFHHCSELESTRIAVIAFTYHDAPCPLPSRDTSPDALIRIATRGVMEILGLDPYQSETQYLDEEFRGIEEWKQSGNMLPLRFHFRLCLPRKRQQSGNMFPLCCLFVSSSLFPHIFNGGKR